MPMLTVFAPVFATAVTPPIVTDVAPAPASELLPMFTVVAPVPVTAPMLVIGAVPLLLFPPILMVGKPVDVPD